MSRGGPRWLAPRYATRFSLLSADIALKAVKVSLLGAPLGEDDGHPSPGGGDGAGGLTPPSFARTDLSMTEPYARLDKTPPELAELRHSIDNIDAAVLHMLAERFKCTRKVGELKAKLNLSPADPEREAAQIARLRSLAVTAELAPEFAEKFLNFLVREVIRHHEIIRNGHADG